MEPQIVRFLRVLAGLKVLEELRQLKLLALLSYPEQINTYLYKEEDLSVSEDDRTPLIAQPK